MISGVVDCVQNLHPLPIILQMPKIPVQYKSRIRPGIYLHCAPKQFDGVPSLLDTSVLSSRGH